MKGNLEVYFNGWRATPEGLAIWPWRKLRHRWSELAKVSTTVGYDRQRYYQTIFVFRLGGSLTLRAMETFSRGSSLGRYAELLGFAIGGAPPNAEIDAKTLGTAEWGTRAVGAELKRLPKSGISEADELRLAQHARARLHHKAALRAVEAALAIRPTSAEALQLRVDLLVDSGADVEKIAAAVERQVSARPGDIGPRRMMLLLDLQRNQHEAGERAREWLEQSPEFEMAAATAGYWLRREDYTAAAETWRRLRANATNEADREMAGGALEYVEKLGANRVFRAKERAKFWSRMALAWAPLALVLLVYGWRAYRAWYPKERKPSHEQAERMQEIVRQMEKTDRDMRELTGLISGDDASLRKRADAGEAAAQYTIAFRILQRARKKPEDVALGVRYLEKAASQNYRFALLDLGERLNEGEGVPANPARAVELLTLAAELGSPRAARIVGENYRDGNGVGKDEAVALAWFEKSAAGGHVYAMALAGWAHEQGLGTTADLTRALEFYRSAAEKDDVWACERLAFLLSRQPNHDPREILKWMKRGAEKGSRSLRLSLGRTALHSVLPDQADELVVLGWLKDEARKDNAEAAYLVGMFYWDGLAGDGNANEAARWWKQAAEARQPEALEQMACCYLFGIGVPRDLAQALEMQDRLAAADKTGKAKARMDQRISAVTARISGENQTQPKPVWRENPRYPHRARYTGKTGEVQIAFDIDQEGFTTNVRATTATSAAFAHAACVAVRMWKFDHGPQKGMMVPVIFNLQK